MLLALWSWREGEWYAPPDTRTRASPRTRRRITRIDLLDRPEEQPLPQPYRAAPAASTPALSAAKMSDETATLLLALRLL